jgi:hypothetical protein
LGKKNVHEIPSGRICIYGTGSGGRNAYNEIVAARPDVSIACFLDSHSEGEFLGLPVYTPAKLQASGLAFDYILVASAYSFEISVILEEHGIRNFVRFYFTWPDQPPPPANTHEEWEKRCRAEVYPIGPDNRLSLPKLDLNLTEHCNLNCAGCNHFCPLAEQWFLTPEQAESELAQLSRLVSHVERIFIVGGEPLLNPSVERFFGIAKKYYPRSILTLWTNGTLLSRMPQSFWESCREFGVEVRFTNYPQLRHKAPELVRLIRDQLGSFYGFDREDCCLMLCEKKTPGKSLSQCALEIITLSRGKIYHCPYEAYVHFFNKRFQARFPERQGYDLAAPVVSAKGLQDYLVSPSELCQYCKDKNDIVLVDWSSTSCSPDAWVLPEAR